MILHRFKYIRLRLPSAGRPGCRYPGILLLRKSCPNLKQFKSKISAKFNDAWSPNFAEQHGTDPFNHIVPQRHHLISRLFDTVYRFNKKMDRFRIVAKLTQAKYGIRSQAASLDTLRKFLIVKQIAIHKTIIPTNAALGDFKPKNNIDHSALRPSWIKKKVIAWRFVFLSVLVIHTR